jgi:phage head maturation protease
VSVERPPRMRERTAATGSLALVENTSTAGEGRTLSGVFSPFDTWQEIRNPLEGHFMERISPFAFKKTIAESGSKVKLLYSHGHDATVGTMLLGKIDRLYEDDTAARYEATLFESVPPLLLDGLRSGIYGSSWRGEILKENFDPKPGRSTSNPKGLPESTVLELRLVDVGPTSLPAYASSTAEVRASAALDRAVVAELGEDLPSWYLESKQPWFLNPKERYAHTR